MWRAVQNDRTLADGYRHPPVNHPLPDSRQRMLPHRRPHIGAACVVVVLDRRGEINHAGDEPLDLEKTHETVSIITKIRGEWGHSVVNIPYLKPQRSLKTSADTHTKALPFPFVFTALFLCVFTALPTALPTALVHCPCPLPLSTAIPTALPELLQTSADISTL